MLKKILTVSTLLSLLLVLVGCAPPMQQSGANNNPYTVGNVTLHIKKGITTKADVSRVFGAPNIVTMQNGLSTWIYQKNARINRESSSSSFATIIFMGAQNSSADSSDSSRTMTLIIQFNKHDRVVSYKTMQTSF